MEHNITATTSLAKSLILTAALTATALPATAAGPAAVDLKSTARFAILSGAAITTTGGGAINGDVGASPITGAAIHLTQAQVDGTIYAVDATGPAGTVIDPALLTAAKGDLTIAYNDAAGRTPVPAGNFLNPGAGNLGGLNLVAGLYKFTSTALVTGANVTLTGGPDDVWIFQVASDLQVASGIHVVLAGGAQARNIFWQVGTSATIGTSAVFKGTILADQAITLNTSSMMDGRALAFGAGVTFNGDTGGLPMPEPPKFTDISRMFEGEVTLVLRTTPYYFLTLQTSTDLTPDSWTTVATATPVAELWTFVHDAALATGPRRFYRAFLTR
ncbi:MAG: ice-binding family protein [Verrucomicrobia bacterium]|nr:ice-binding family protein [Verrucomicrobiota bacterium]